MLVVILLYDQLLFRPLVAWADKFRVELSVGQDGARILAAAPVPPHPAAEHGRRPRSAARLRRLAAWPGPRFAARPRRAAPRGGMRALGEAVWYAGRRGAHGAPRLARRRDRRRPTSAGAICATALGLGAITLLRVVVLIALASLIWVPRRRADRPAAAAGPDGPADRPVPGRLSGQSAVSRRGRGDRALRPQPGYLAEPLMILGTQWYILFNVIAGASAFPNDLQEAAANLHIGGWQWWRQVILPGIFPYYVTGAITASGGCWNASIVAEAVSWGDTHLAAHGLGAYIAEATAAGDFPRIVLGIAVMSRLCHPVQPAALAAALPARRAALPARLRGGVRPWPPRHAPCSRSATCARAFARPSGGERVVLDDVNLTPGRARDRRPARPLGLRQVHPAAHRRRPRPADRRRGRLSRQADRRARPRASPWCSRPSPCSPG